MTLVLVKSKTIKFIVTISLNLTVFLGKKMTQTTHTDQRLMFSVSAKCTGKFKA